MDQINVAVVGYGGMGGWHTDRIRNMEKFNLAGVWDIDPAQLKKAEENGIHAYASFEDVLADESVELLVIATWNDVHKPLCIAAMRAGKNVISEKPVTLSVKDLDDMIAVSKETGKLFTVHQNRRWDDDYLTMRSIAEKNLLGKVFRIESRVQGSRGIPGDWRRKKECGGGMMLDWGVHLIDRVLDMVPEKVTSLYCQATHVTNKEVDDGFTLSMTFESGLQALIEVGTNNFIDMPLWYVAAEDGTAMIQNWELEGKMMHRIPGDETDAQPILAGSGLTKTMAPRRRDTVEELPLPKVEFDANALYVNLVDTVEGTAERIIKPEQTLRVLRLMEAALQSAETGEAVAFEA